MVSPLFSEVLLLSVNTLLSIVADLVVDVFLPETPLLLTPDIELFLRDGRFKFSSVFPFVPLLFLPLLPETKLVAVFLRAAFSPYITLVAEDLLLP